MELILWRHAEAHDPREGQSDLDRALTARGEKQAQRMAVWLNRQLPQTARVLVSPARRTEQTAKALGRRYRPCPELVPGCAPATLLALADWPHAPAPVLIVGHQPTLGQTIARVLGLQAPDCAVKKGAVWWLRSREREGQQQALVVSVQTAELL